jgi:hypothetical protein
MELRESLSSLRFLRPLNAQPEENLVTRLATFGVDVTPALGVVCCDTRGGAHGYQLRRSYF